MRGRALLIVSIVTLMGSMAWGQEPQPQPSIFGVMVDAAGNLRYREQDAKSELAAIRAREKANATPTELKFLSLRKAMDEARSLSESRKAIPSRLRYLDGITQLRYVLVYPDEKDLVIAGPAEAWDEHPLEPKGKVSGRPVLHLDDLIVAIRMARQREGIQRFGCSIDPPAHSVQKGQEVLRQYGSRPRRELAAALAQALGPQQIRFFGAPADTRMAFVCVAADYRLKRYSIGLEPVPVAGVGHSIDNSRAAGNGFWFETLYEPLLVSADGNAYEIRGQRLQLKAGAVPFDERGATESAKAFARRFTEKMTALAAAAPLFADLQNVADVALLAALIRQDGLDRRIGWDLGWVDDVNVFRVRTVPVPRSTDTITHFTSGSLAAGGVGINVTPWVEVKQLDDKRELEAVGKKTAKSGG